MMGPVTVVGSSLVFQRDAELAGEPFERGDAVDLVPKRRRLGVANGHVVVDIVDGDRRDFGVALPAGVGRHVDDVVVRPADPDRPQVCVAGATGVGIHQNGESSPLTVAPEPVLIVRRVGAELLGVELAARVEAHQLARVGADILAGGRAEQRPGPVERAILERHLLRDCVLELAAAECLERADRLAGLEHRVVAHADADLHRAGGRRLADPVIDRAVLRVLGVQKLDVVHPAADLHDVIGGDHHDMRDAGDHHVGAEGPDQGKRALRYRAALHHAIAHAAGHHGRGLVGIPGRVDLAHHARVRRGRCRARGDLQRLDVRLCLPCVAVGRRAGGEGRNQLGLRGPCPPDDLPSAGNVRDRVVAVVARAPPVGRVRVQRRPARAAPTIPEPIPGAETAVVDRVRPGEARAIGCRAGVVGRLVVGERGRRRCLGVDLAVPDAQVRVVDGDAVFVVRRGRAKLAHVVRLHDLERQVCGVRPALCRRRRDRVRGHVRREADYHAVGHVAAGRQVGPPRERPAGLPLDDVRRRRWRAVHGADDACRIDHRPAAHGQAGDRHVGKPLARQRQCRAGHDAAGDIVVRVGDGPAVHMVEARGVHGSARHARPGRHVCGGAVAKLDAACRRCGRHAAVRLDGEYIACGRGVAGVDGGHGHAAPDAHAAHAVRHVVPALQIAAQLGVSRSDKREREQGRRQAPHVNTHVIVNPAKLGRKR